MQRLGKTTALFKAPDASGVSVMNAAGVKTDVRGYTTMVNLAPFLENIISLNPVTLPANVAIPQTDTRVVSTEGARIPASCATRLGGRALITVTQVNGKPFFSGAVARLVGQGENRRETG
ncbi:fimbria/pilus outer membrane usher protein, partial [Salmonella enterica]|uniref:fimbria/pilus outer membrane usher protein n=1 Tax=Salmonella enterica TaxID=28901 RepID=UPI00398C2532